MNPLIHDFAIYLQTKGFGTLGTDIFLTEYEIQNPKEVIVVKSSGGPGSDNYLALAKEVITIVVRRKKPSDAILVSDNIRNAIARTVEQPLILSGKYAMNILTASARVDLGRIQNGLYEVYQNFEVMYREQS